MRAGSHSFIHSFYNYLLGTLQVPGTVLALRIRHLQYDFMWERKQSSEEKGCSHDRVMDQGRQLGWEDLQKCDSPAALGAP